MTTTIETVWRTTSLVPQVCGECGITFGFPNDLKEQRLRDGAVWYCPNGHPRVFTDTDARRLKQAEARARHLEDQLQAANDEAEQARRALVRERSRFAAGVCPCCTRSFDNVRRHMATKHPDYDLARVEGKPATFRCSCGDRFETYRGLRIHQGKAPFAETRHRTKV